MRFIRDIIAEKTQAAAQEDAAALRYPLRLREQDRADVASSDHSQPVNIEAQTPVAVERETVSPAYDVPDETQVDLSAISAALLPTAEPREPTSEMDLTEESETSNPHLGFEDAKDGFRQDGLETDEPSGSALEAPQPPLTTTFGQKEAARAVVDDGFDAAPLDFSDPPVASEPPHVSSEAPAVPPAAEIPQPESQTSPEDIDLSALQLNVNAHKPASGRGSKGRVKTRLLGFSAPASANHDPLSQSREAPVSAQAQFPVGWLVVVDGPGRGASFSLFDGLTQIGRGEGQTVRLDFGDTTISRENHAAIAFDGEQRRFFFGHGGKANLVRLNGQPVLSTEVLNPNSIIRIGETTLRFVALCGEDFAWGDSQQGSSSIG